MVGRCTEFSELWMQKFLEFLKSFPDKIREDWEKSLDLVTTTQTVDGIPYTAVYNPWREKRLSLKERINVPGYFETIRSYHECKKNTVIFGEEYDPYYLLVNIFPLGPDHVTIAHKQYNQHAKVNRRIKREDLEKILKVHDDVPSITIWHNMRGVGATQESWEHFQGIGLQPPVRSAKKITYSSGSRTFTMPDYPGANIIFNGKDRIRNTLGMIEKLYDQDKNHAIIIDDGYIYIIPVKDDTIGSAFGLNEKSRIGGFEAEGNYVALTWGDFEKFLKGELAVKKVLGEGLYKTEELDLFSML